MTHDHTSEDKTKLRPTFGNPRDVRTNPNFPAARRIVEIKEPAGEWGLAETRLARHLHGIAYNELLAGKEKHRVHLTDLMFTKHNGREQIKRAVKRLQTTLIEVQDEQKEWGSVQFLGEAYISDGWLYFEFPDTVRDIIKNPDLYNRISLRVIYLMGSRFSVLLYQYLCGYYKMTNPFIRFPMDDLHDYLGTRDKTSIHRPAIFKRTVLEKAKEEINKFAEFTVDYALVKKGRSIMAVDFHLKPKDADALTETTKLIAQQDTVAA